jgi:hypothetical protein
LIKLLLQISSISRGAPRPHKMDYGNAADCLMCRRRFYRLLKNHHALFFVLALLPLLASATVYAGAHNLWRESRYLFEEEVQIFRILHFLNLNSDLPLGRRWLPDEQNLFNFKWRSYEYKTGHGPNTTYDDWVKTRTSGHTFAGAFGLLFGFEFWISLMSALLLIMYGTPLGRRGILHVLQLIELAM